MIAKTPLLLASLALGLTLTASATADVIPPDMKPISHTVSIAGIDKHPEMTFVAYPYMAGFGRPDIKGEHRVLKEGDALPFGKFSQPFVYAFPKSEKIDFSTKSAEWWEDKARVRTKDAFSCNRFVSDSDPAVKRETVYTIKAIKDGVVVVEQTRDERFDAAGEKVSLTRQALGILALPLAALLALGSLLRRRRK